MAVSVDFLQSMMQRFIEKMEEITTAIDLDRRNARSMYDNMTIELGRKIGAVDAKVEMGVADLQEQISDLQERSTRIEAKIDLMAEQVAYLAKMQSDKG